LITYPLYLIHQDLGYILLRSTIGWLNRYLLLVLVIATMIGLSWLIHVGPEKWLARHLRSLLSRTKRIISPVKISSEPSAPAMPGFLFLIGRALSGEPIRSWRICFIYFMPMRTSRSCPTTSDIFAMDIGQNSWTGWTLSTRHWRDCHARWRALDYLFATIVFSS